MIGVLYICTGKYSSFWKDFFISAENFFLPSFEKKYFVFTDAEEIYAEKNGNVKKIYQQFLGWPFDTLMRFDIFLKSEGELQNCDYLFFLNANIRFVTSVYTEILPDDYHDGLVGVVHPYFWDKDNSDFSYERNNLSTASIAHGDGKSYFMGGFNGGKTDAFLTLIHTLSSNIQIDLENKIIALWHDESHLNKYLLFKNPLILPPSYGYPEGSDLHFEPKVIILDKLKYGGHSYLRSAK